MARGPVSHYRGGQVFRRSRQMCDNFQAVPDGVAPLKVRKGAFDALIKGSGAPVKVK